MTPNDQRVSMYENDEEEVIKGFPLLGEENHVGEVIILYILLMN